MNIFKTHYIISTLLLTLPLFLLTGVLHLLFASCQFSKFHYIIQAYYAPEYLPKLFIRKEGANLEGKIASSSYKTYIIGYDVILLLPSRDYVGGLENLVKKWNLDYKKCLQGEYINSR